MYETAQSQFDKSVFSSEARRISRLLCVAGLVFLCACSKKAPPPELIINTAPKQGAALSINGVPYGRTPAAIRTLTPGRQYYAILELYGFEEKTQAVLAPEEGLTELTIELTPLIGRLAIESVPPGARVYLNDGIPIGTTPFANYAIPIGGHTLTLSRVDHKDYTLTFEVQPDRRYEKLIELVPLDGFVEVYSQPSGASIFINDHLRSEHTPARIALPPGDYTVGVAQKGFITQEFSVEITPNNGKDVDATLAPGDAPPGMILIPAGEFTFGVKDGAPDEAPQRKIHLDAYYIDKFEVTNSKFAEVFPNHGYEVHFADMPVTGVSWRQAADYARAVGKRLPTEQEWEKAARGTTGYEYPWGNGFSIENLAMQSSRSRDKGVSEVGSYRTGASPFGVLDMSGNAMEWTNNWYAPYEGNEQITTEYGQIFRVLRGGSYLSKDSFDVRASRRHYDRPEETREDYGFRCVKTIE